MYLSLRKGMLPMRPDVLSKGLSAALPHLSPLPLPSPRETHFWYLVPNEVKDVSLLREYHELLSPCERESILCVKDDKHQKNALLARALVRTTLARYTSCRMTPKSLKFKKNGFGKPEVLWQNDDDWVPPSLHFNVSHTSSLIACGVTLDAPIGIDVEEKERKPKHSVLSFARRYFSPDEVEFLQAFSEPESQRREFIKIWTLKEAYVKALGRGFSAAPFKDFTIRLKEKQDTRDSLSDVGHMLISESIGCRIVVEVPEDSESLTANWKFALLELDGSHYAAVCVETHRSVAGGESCPLRLKLWKTVPLVGDESVMKTDAVINIAAGSS